MNQGFDRVRPLKGGLDAWIEAGYSVESITVAAVADVPPGPSAQPVS
jgi:hypothetical protein